MNLHDLVKYVGLGATAITILGFFLVLVVMSRANPDAPDPKLFKTVRAWLLLFFVAALVAAGCGYANICEKRRDLVAVRQECTAKLAAARDAGAAKTAALGKEWEARVAALQREKDSKIDNLNTSLGQANQQLDVKVGALSAEKREQEKAFLAKIEAMKAENGAALAKLATEKEEAEKGLAAKVEKASTDAEQAAKALREKIQAAGALQAELTQALAGFQAKLAGSKAKVDQLRTDLAPLLAKNAELATALGAGK